MLTAYSWRDLSDARFKIANDRLEQYVRDLPIDQQEGWHERVVKYEQRAKSLIRQAAQSYGVDLFDIATGVATGEHQLCKLYRGERIMHERGSHPGGLSDDSHDAAPMATAYANNNPAAAAQDRPSRNDQSGTVETSNEDHIRSFRCEGHHPPASPVSMQAEGLTFAPSTPTLPAGLEHHQGVTFGTVENDGGFALDNMDSFAPEEHEWYSWFSPLLTRFDWPQS